MSNETSQLDYESLAIKLDEAKKRFIHPFSAHKKFDFARDLAEKYRVRVQDTWSICQILISPIAGIQRVSANLRCVERQSTSRTIQTSIQRRKVPRILVPMALIERTKARTDESKRRVLARPRQVLSASS